MRGYVSGDDVVKALSSQDAAILGPALAQLRHACTTRPTPIAILEYLRQDPSASAVLDALSVSRQANSIHLLSNCLYTLAHILSLPSADPLGARKFYDPSRIIHDIVRHHSKSLHRCFAPGRTEATLACLSLLYVCVSWNDGACAHVVVTDVRWDQKTISRLLDTRQTVASKGIRTKAKTGSKQAPPKISKLKGSLHQVDVRTLVLKLIMKIMTTAELSPALKLEFWKTKGLSTALFKGLRSDGYHCVAFVLNNLWEGVIRKDGWTGFDKLRSFDATGLDKAHHSRWDVVDHTAVTILVQLLDHQDADEASNPAAVGPESISELVERFLTRLTDYIADLTPCNVFQSHVNSRLPHYRILHNLIKSLLPTQSIYHQRVILHILKRCPSLCSTLWRHAAPAAEPSCTVNWISSVGFASRVTSIPVTIPTSAKHRVLLTTDNKNTITNICSNLLAQCFPTPLGKTWFTKTLQTTNGLVVYCCLTMLVIGMKKAASIWTQIQLAVELYEESSCLNEPSTSSGPWSNLLMTFTEMLQSILPELQIFIALLQKAHKLVTSEAQASSTNNTERLPLTTVKNEVKAEESSSDLISVHVLAFLQLCHDLIPNSIYSIRFDYGKLIPVYLKMYSSDFPPNETSAATTLDPLIFLCQSRILHLVGHSASTNHMMPSSTLLVCLLSLSSSSKTNLLLSQQSGYVPICVSQAARKTLIAVLQCNPHLRDLHERHEIEIWIDILTESRLQDECLPLIGFLDDCIRACLRSPLKYFEESQDLAPTTLIGKQRLFSMLFAAMVNKTRAVVKAFVTGGNRSSSKAELIRQLIRFHNLHLFAALSSSQEVLPIVIIKQTSNILQQIFDTLPSTTEQLLSSCEYIGPMIIEILQASTQHRRNLNQRLKKYRVEWPSYVSAGIFSRQLVTLNFLHRKLIWPQVETEGGKRKKKGVLMVEFGDEALHDDDRSGDLVKICCQDRKQQNLFFMIRVLECENQQSSVEDNPQLKIDGFDWEKLKCIIQLTTDYVDDNPELIREFLDNLDTRQILQSSIKAVDSTSLFSDVLCRLFMRLDVFNTNHRGIAKTYANFIIDFFSSSGSTDRTAPLSEISAGVACTLCPFLELPHQIQLFDTILKFTKLKSSIPMENSGLVLSLNKMVEILVGSLRNISTPAIDLSLSSIQTLIKLSCYSEPEDSVIDLLSILVKRLPIFFNLSQKLGSDTSTPVTDEEREKSMQMWHKLVSQTVCKKSGISNKKLELMGDLSRRDPQTYASCVTCISTSTVNQFVESLSGAYSLVLACIEISATEAFEKSWPEPYAIRIGSAEIRPWISSIVSVLFNQKVDLGSSLDLVEQRSQRIVGTKVIEAVHLSGAFDFKLDEFFASFATASELLPAYAETLNTLRVTRSTYLAAYVARCLRWLVRRFAEDDSLSIETQELTESLTNQLGLLDHPALPVQLVNPVLSAALDRWLGLDFVMRLVNALALYTMFTDVDALKHTRSVVENRQFRTLMNSKDGETEGLQQASTVMSFVTTMITSFPTISVKIRLSSSLIGYYGGLISSKDRLILRVFRIEDLCTQDAEFDKLLMSWKVPGQAVTTGPAVFTELINHIDSNKMYFTCLQTLKADLFNTSSKEPVSYYDVDFVLPYFYHVMDQSSASSMVFWTCVATSNLLGLAMCALSSSSRAWQLLGDQCLCKAYGLLKAVNHNEAGELLLPLEHFRCLHFSRDSTVESRAVPRLTTLFLVHCLHTFSAKPESTLYPRLYRFLMQRAMLDVTDVPMLYTMLYPDGDCPLEDQRWLVQLLRDGLNTSRDWKIMDRRQTFEIFTTLVLSVGPKQSDPDLRVLLLQLFERATAHNQPCTKLVTQSALMTIIKRFGLISTIELEQVIKILKNVTGRLGLLHDNVAIGCVDKIIEVASEICRSPFLESSAESGVFNILRGVLVNWKLWLKQWNRYQLLRIGTLVELLVSKHITISSADLVKDIRARLVYLEYKEPV